MLEGDGAVVGDAQVCQDANAVWLEAGANCLQGCERAGQAPVPAITNLQSSRKHISDIVCKYVQLQADLCDARISYREYVAT